MKDFHLQSFADLSRRSGCLFSFVFFLLRRHGIFAPPLETMMTSFSTTVFCLDARRLSENSARSEDDRKLRIKIRFCEVNSGAICRTKADF